MASGRVMVCMLAAAMLAGCGSAPSYYTARVTGQPAAYASVPATAGPAGAVEQVDEAAPVERRTARRPQRATGAVMASEPPQAAARTAALPAPNMPQVEAGSEPENTGAVRNGATPPKPAARADDPVEQAREARREQAINRSIYSICRGC